MTARLRSLYEELLVAGHGVGAGRI
jgi:hypothetical protein